MTSPDPTAPTASLTAQIEERILAPLRRNPRARQRFAVTVTAILALHGGVLAALLYRDRAAPQLVQSETPIEIVVEKPPEPQEKKPEPPKPPAKEIEKPAMSAPRAPSEQKVDTEELQKETHAPKAPTPPKDGKPEPVKEAAASPSETPPTPEKTEEPTDKEDVLKKDAEVLAQATPKPQPRPKKLASALPKKPRKAKTALQQLAGASPLQNFSFARPTKKSPVTGGNEDSRYLAIVYGMIMRHRSSVEVPDGAASATIAFELDDDGNLLGMGVQRSSGYREVDAEAADAIRRASPFPPPPAGAPHGLVATVVYGDGRSSRAMDGEDN